MDLTSGRDRLEREREIVGRAEAVPDVLLQAPSTTRATPARSPADPGQVGGSSFRIAFIVSTAPSRRNAGTPKSISKKHRPK